MTTPTPTPAEAQAAVATLLRYIGCDPERPVIRDTPDRVVRALAEMTAGYAMDPREHIARHFDTDESVHGLVLVDSIQFASLCEHHLLPFHGTITIGYLPRNGRVLGLSKMVRLVECYARRLQLQERLGQQLANVIHECLPARGTGVVIRAKHSCMTVRGVNQPSTVTKTVALVGGLQSDPVQRSIFLDAAL